MLQYWHNFKGPLYLSSLPASPPPTQLFHFSPSHSLADIPLLYYNILAAVEQPYRRPCGHSIFSCRMQPLPRLCSHSISPAQWHNQDFPKWGWVFASKRTHITSRMYIFRVCWVGVVGPNGVTVPSGMGKKWRWPVA